jgi:galactose mutarotase-like enzyme
LGVGSCNPVITPSAQFPDSVRQLKNGLLVDAPKLFHANELIVTHELFDDDALIFLDYSPKTITLLRKDELKVSVSRSNFEHTALWGKPGANFVCIEPWAGYADTMSAPSSEISKKRGIHQISNGRAEHGYSITIH